jgi:hypothetical protein
MRQILLVVTVLLGAFWLYQNGYIKMPKNWKDLPNTELNDPCIRKDIDGKYSLLITFKQSENRRFEKQKLELGYEFFLEKDECIVKGINAMQISSSVIDTITKKPIPPKKENKDIVLTGKMENDSLELELYLKNKTGKKCKTTVRFAYPNSEKKIQIKEGTFFEECANSKGKAVLEKLSN